MSSTVALFEKFAVQVLEAARDLKAAGKLLGLSWDQVQRIMERAVGRGLERRDLGRVRHVGLDEKSFAKGQSYVSVMTDLEGSRVLEVMDGKDAQAGEMLLWTLPPEVAQALEAVCMDMSGAYMAAVARELPGADIVHDRFHVSAMLNDAVRAVHREENRKLRKEGDDRLKGTQRLFGFAPGNFSADQAVRFAELREATLKTSRAWAIKEMFRSFWDYTYEGSARKFFRKWFGWASRSRLKAVVKAAKTLKGHFENVITYLRHPISNAATEGLNSKIQAIKNNARGFRSFHNYRTRILFFCGKLDLYPL